MPKIPKMPPVGLGAPRIAGSASEDIKLQVMAARLKEELLAEVEGLQGPQGPVGPKGEDGKDGKDGVDGRGIADAQVTGVEATESRPSGTKIEVTFSDGQTQSFTVYNGQDGQNGSAGEDGKSAYDSWIDQGNTGSEQDFIDDLKGEAGHSPTIEISEDGYWVIDGIKSDVRATGEGGPAPTVSIKVGEDSYISDESGQIDLTELLQQGQVTTLPVVGRVGNLGIRRYEISTTPGEAYSLVYQDWAEKRGVDALGNSYLDYSREYYEAAQEFSTTATSVPFEAGIYEFQISQIALNAQSSNSELWVNDPETSELYSSLQTVTYPLCALAIPDDEHKLSINLVYCGYRTSSEDPWTDCTLETISLQNFQTQELNNQFNAGWYIAKEFQIDQTIEILCRLRVEVQI